MAFQSPPQPQAWPVPCLLCQRLRGHIRGHLATWASCQRDDWVGLVLMRMGPIPGALSGGTAQDQERRSLWEQEWGEGQAGKQELWTHTAVFPHTQVFPPELQRPGPAGDGCWDEWLCPQSLLRAHTAASSVSHLILITVLCGVSL